MKTRFGSLALAAAFLSIPTQARAGDRIASADLRADAALLQRAFEELHPGLLRYNSPEQIGAAFDALEKSFAEDRTLGEAFVALSELTAKVKCGHTQPNPFNQSDAVVAALLEAPRIPFCFRWIDRRMIVTRSFADDPRIAPGVEILALDGVSAADVLARLLPLARADGGNDAKRIASMQLDGVDRFEAFDAYWPLLFPSAAPDVTLRLRTNDGGEATVRAAKLSAKDRRERAAAKSDAGAEPWDTRVIDKTIVVLRMPTWAMFNSKWNWRAFLDDTFDELVENGATDLIVDLRGNEGGNDVGDVIVSHLVSAPAPRVAYERRVRYGRVPEDLAPHLDTWDPSFNDWGDAVSEQRDGFFRLRRDADDDPGAPIEPEEPRFAGRVWVLIGATNSSATFEFAQLVRKNELGTLVGQPTGGNQRGINGGAFFFLRLPRSGIEIDLPLIGLFPDGDVPDAGIEPDVTVDPTAADIASGRDVELDAVLARIRAKTPPAK